MAYRYLEQEDDGNDAYSGSISYVCPSWAPAVGFLGITSAVVFASEYIYFASPSCFTFDSSLSTMIFGSVLINFFAFFSHNELLH